MKITLMLYILTLLCNIRSFNALIIIKLEYTVLALPDPDIFLTLFCHIPQSLCIILSDNIIFCLLPLPNIVAQNIVGKIT